MLQIIIAHCIPPTSLAATKIKALGLLSTFPFLGDCTATLYLDYTLDAEKQLKTSGPESGRALPPKAASLIVVSGTGRVPHVITSLGMMEEELVWLCL